ncbi:MAG: hypothetical protein ABUK01_15035 [Leptospirales bacterium]
MGDEDKIKDLVPLAKAEFLPEEVRDTEPGPPDYSLEHEFAKAKSNKSLTFYFVLLLFIGGLIGGTIFYTQHLESGIAKEQISFAEFTPDLKAALSTDNEEKKLNEAKNELETVLKQQDAKIKQIELDYSEKIGGVRSQNISESEKTELIKNLKLEQVKEVTKVESDYASEITSKKENVVQRQTLLQNKKDARAAKINKAETMITNYKELQKMQLEKLEAQITLRYNPVYSSSALQKILRKSGRRREKAPVFLPYEERLYTAGLLNKTEHEAVRKKIEEYEKLVERMQKIPYTNSVRPSVDILQDSAYFIITKYEELVNRLTGRVTYQSEMIRKYRNAFLHYAETSPDSGVVVSASNKKSVLVSMKPMLAINNGDEAFIFRTEDDLIGTIVFSVENNTVKASVKELLPGRSIQPFDKIFLKRAKIGGSEGESTNGDETSTDTDNTTTNGEEQP